MKKKTGKGEEQKIEAFLHVIISPMVYNSDYHAVEIVSAPELRCFQTHERV